MYIVHFLYTTQIQSIKSNIIYLIYDYYCYSITDGCRLHDNLALT